MNTTEKEKFESLWADFITLFKGKLIEVSNKQTLSASLARLILADAASTWSSDYEINGRWLQKFTQEEPRKAELIREIIEKDMTLQEIDKKSELPMYCDIILPFATAGIGFAVSYYLGYGKLAQACSALIPGALMYPAIKKFRNTQIKNNKQNAIDQYISQLDKYYNSIISILS